jgi:hypothetical protein
MRRVLPRRFMRMSVRSCSTAGAIDREAT